MLCYMQAGLEEKISQLLDEKANLSSKGVLPLYFITSFWCNNIFFALLVLPLSKKYAYV